jgi:peptidoglycan/xylan/chitin deacetylase (PgdA/CDA1 family)
VRRRTVVLCYHAISDEWRHDLAVTPRALELHLRSLLLRGFRPVSAGEAVERGGRALHVTFDDGFRSVGPGLPVLERLGIPATVFVVTSYAGDGGPVAVPELAAERDRHAEHLATMDWDALRALVERGVEVGSHTVTHAHLGRLDDAELARELRDSRGRCEDELGRPCRYLAYPYGEHDERAQRAARAAGYRAAFALASGADARNRYAFPRVDLYGYDGVVRASVKTSPLGRPLAKALWRLRRVGRGAA